jgi:MFS family permease
MLIAFPFIEKRVTDPMFRLKLLKNRMFAAGNIASLLASLARGGVTLMLVILLQAVWLPLHGFSFVETPFWAGVYMIPFSAGFVVMGPLSGYLSDKYGARGFSTGGMILTTIAFISLSTLSYDFGYFFFGLLVFIMGLAFGMFSSPNTASIMNTVPREERGAASGMRSTLQNTGSTIGLGILFSIVLIILAANLPASLASAAAKAGAAQLSASLFAKIPPTEAIFSAFLGYNPMQTILGQLPKNITNSISHQAIATMTSKIWFPQAIGPALAYSLRIAFYINAGLAALAAVASVLRGKKY